MVARLLELGGDFLLLELVGNAGVVVEGAGGGSGHSEPLLGGLLNGLDVFEGRHPGVGLLRLVVLLEGLGGVDQGQHL